MEDSRHSGFWKAWNTFASDLNSRHMDPDYACLQAMLQAQVMIGAELAFIGDCLIRLTTQDPQK